MRSTDMRVPELDGLRGLACLMVLVHHYAVGIAALDAGPVFETLHSITDPFLIGGVDLFFVLSGFLISGILMDHRGSDNYYLAFWARRAARILPVYGILFGAYFLTLAIRPEGAWGWANDWLLKPPLPLWSYATFTQNIAIAVANDPGPYFVGVTWSLAVEEQFYLILPFVVAFAPRRVVVGIAVACVVAAPIIRAGFAQHWDWWAAYALLPARMENLMCGVLVACIIRNETALGIARRYRRLIDLAIIALGIILSAGLAPKLGVGFQYTSLPLLYLLIWLPYSLLSFLFGLVLLRIFLHDGGALKGVLRSRVLVGAGAISYGVYMYHQAVNGLLHGFILGQQPHFATSADIGVTTLSVLVLLAVATTSYVLVEKPLRRLGQRMKYTRQRRGQGSQPIAANLGRV